MPAFNKVLVANRGAVAARVLRALQRAWASRRSRSIRKRMPARRICELASETVHIGAAPARESYLNQDALLAALKQHGRRRRASGLRLPVGERGIRRARAGRGRALHRAVAAVDRRDGPQDAGARTRGALRHADGPGLGRAAARQGRDSERGAQRSAIRCWSSRPAAAAASACCRRAPLRNC